MLNLSKPVVTGLSLQFLSLFFVVSAVCLVTHATRAQSVADSVAPPLFYTDEENMKSVIIGLEFRKNQTPLIRFTKVINGPPKTFKQSPRGLRVEIIAGERISSSFNIPDPFVLRQWEYPPRRNEFEDGAGLRHKTIVRDTGRARIVFPFDKDLQRANIIDEEKGALIISVDLKTMAAEFCENAKDQTTCGEGEEPKPAVGADLIVKGVTAPTDVAKAGEALDGVSVDINNQGEEKAIGTIDEQEGGYVVDMVLSKDDALPSRQTPATEFFVEDNSLRGGNLSNTPTLLPGDTFTTKTKVVIPKETPPGWYCLGVLADSTQKIIETNEQNNTNCFHIKIVEE